jgi:hypothetical protein
MGYSVTASAYIGVTLAPSAQQFTQIELFCRDHPHVRHTILGNEDDVGPLRCCVYVQHLELEEWGHSAEIDETCEETLKTSELHRKSVEELLQTIYEQPQELRLVLSLHGG